MASTFSTQVAASADDWERHGGTTSDDLELGEFRDRDNSVGLRFDEVEVPDGARIESAFLVFEAEADQSGSARFRVELERGEADPYRNGDTADDRSYLDRSVTWDNVSNWQAGQTYRSVDISPLLESFFDGNDDDEASLGFRLTGTGTRDAHSADSSGSAPQLVINYAGGDDNNGGGRPDPNDGGDDDDDDNGGGNGGDGPLSLRVWLGHDGYSDPDDNLAMLVGAAKADANARANGNVTVEALVFGDTIDGGQFRMLNRNGDVPNGFDWQSRFSDDFVSERAAGNYAFYRQYSRDAIDDLDRRWDQFDLLAEDNGGRQAWNFDGSLGSITRAARELALDIKSAVQSNDNEVVVYSAGGGANLAAEAIAALRNEGFSESDLRSHFAVVQHSGTNWQSGTEARAREITREYTIAISDQNFDRYSGGARGPGLKDVGNGRNSPTGSNYDDDFHEAVAVATGQMRFQGLRNDERFFSTWDASDAGSHAFATDPRAIGRALDDRLSGRDGIDSGSGVRDRVVYDDFDAFDVARLLGTDFLL